jgi:hypothetical protein
MHNDSNMKFVEIQLAGILRRRSQRRHNYSVVISVIGDPHRTRVAQQPPLTKLAMLKTYFGYTKGKIG